MRAKIVIEEQNILRWPTSITEKVLIYHHTIIKK